MKNLWIELQRRKVVRVAIVYLIGAWVLLQVGDTVLGLGELPGWIGKALLIAVIAGLPIAIVLAWVFDITPEGIVSTDAAADPSGQRFEFAELGPIEIAQLDLGRPQLTPLIGRSKECQTIAEKLDDAAAGTGGIVLIGGEPGVGKTRLSEEVLELGLQRGMLPLIGHAYEERGAPFIVSTEILEDITRALPPAVLRNALGDTAPEIARLLPDLRRLFPDIPDSIVLPPEQQQRYLFNALLEFTQRLSNACPLVMLLDDLQWADESSTLLLEHLAPHVQRMSVLMVVTYRDVPIDMGEPFKRALAQLSRQDFVIRVPLRQLNREDVAALLESLGGSGVPEEVIDVINHETEGNALFVKSVYQHLAEEGRLFDADGNWLTGIDTNKLAVPEGLRLVIERRFERLTEATLKALSLAAVIGLRFDVGLLEKTHGESSDHVLDAIEEAEAAGLVFATTSQREARYEFSHGLVRQALLDGLSTARRQRVHLQIGTTMEQMSGDARKDVADIAQHLYRAGTAADAQKARHFLELAGAQALEASAADEAVIAFDRALELDDDIEAGQRANLLYQRGLAFRSLGRWEDTSRDWNEALPIFESKKDRDRIAEICWQVAFQIAWSNDFIGAEAWARRGLEAVDDSPSEAHCRLLGILAMVINNRLDYGLWEEYQQRAIAMAEELEDDRLLGAEALMGRQFLGEHWLKAGIHVETADRAIALVRRDGSPWDLSLTLGAAMLGYLANGRFDDVESLYEESLSLAREHGDFGSELHAQAAHGFVQSFRGHLDVGRPIMQERIDWCRSVDFAWTSIVLPFLGMPEFWAGNWATASQLANEAVEQPITGTMAGMEHAFQLLMLAYTKDADAAPLIEQLLPQLPTAGVENHVGAWHVGMSVLEAAALLGMKDQCAALYSCAKQLSAAGTKIVWTHGSSEKLAGIAAAAGENWELATQHFDNAEKESLEMGNKIEEADTLRWRAQMLQWRNQAGDEQAAQEILATARSAYTTIGMMKHAALTDEMLTIGADLT